MLIKKEKKTCPYSGLEFFPKRSNQIYASSEYRIAHNNEKNNAKRRLMAPKHKALSKNRDILESILGGSKEKAVHVEFLKGKGFDFTVFSGVYKNPKHESMCYVVHEFHYIKQVKYVYKIYRND